MASALVQKQLEVLKKFVDPVRLQRQLQILAARTNGVQVVLENVSFENNAAASLRTIEALGIQTVHICHKYSPFTINESITTGAHKWLTLRYHDDVTACLKELRANGYTVLASDLSSNTKRLPERSDIRLEPGVAIPKYALVFGNEQRGVSKAFRSVADATFQLPMTGFCQSFNISVAVGLATFHMFSHGFCDHHKLDAKEQEELHLRWLLRDVNHAQAILARANIQVDDF